MTIRYFLISLVLRTAFLLLVCHYQFKPLLQAFLSDWIIGECTDEYEKGLYGCYLCVSNVQQLGFDAAQQKLDR